MDNILTHESATCTSHVHNLQERLHIREHCYKALFIIKKKSSQKRGSSSQPGQLLLEKSLRRSQLLCLSQQHSCMIWSSCALKELTQLEYGEKLAWLEGWPYRLYHLKRVTWAIVIRGDWLWKKTNIKYKNTGHGAAVLCWKLSKGAQSFVFCWQIVRE